MTFDGYCRPDVAEQPPLLELGVEVFRSPRHELMYLYLPATETLESAAPASDVASTADLSVIPELLLKRFGPPEFSFAFVLRPDRELAAVDGTAVLRAIAEQGFYLQMPPVLSMPETPDAQNPHERPARDER